MHIKLLDIKQVTTIVGLSKATIYRKIEKGEFPDSRKLGSKTVRWLALDIQEWIESLPSEREDA